MKGLSFPSENMICSALEHKILVQEYWRALAPCVGCRWSNEVCPLGHSWWQLGPQSEPDQDQCPSWRLYIITYVHADKINYNKEVLVIEKFITYEVEILVMNVCSEAMQGHLSHIYKRLIYRIIIRYCLNDFIIIIRWHSICTVSVSLSHDIPSLFPKVYAGCTFLVTSCPDLPVSPGIQ